MKATQNEIGIPEFTQNDVIMTKTLMKIYALMFLGKQSPAHTIINKAKLDQLVLHLMAAPDAMIPSC